LRKKIPYWSSSSILIVLLHKILEISEIWKILKFFEIFEKKIENFEII
jgi:hypothetical protein